MKNLQKTLQRISDLLSPTKTKSTESKNIYQTDHTQTPEVFTLIKQFDNLAVKKYLKLHPKHIHLKGWMDDTPLHVAASSGNYEIIKYLVEHGASVNAERSGMYATPLCWADTIDIAKYLLEHGATMNDKELFFATRQDKVDIVDLLLQNGAKIDEKEPQYLQCKSIDCIKIYKNHKIDLNGCDKYGRNLLHTLTWLDLPKVFDFAYQSGVEWKNDSNKRTPYYLAKQDNRTAILNHFICNYKDLITQKTDIIAIENYTFESVIFLRQLKDYFIALTTNNHLVQYKKIGNELIMSKIIKLQVSNIRNFTVDKNNNLIVPTADNALLIIDPINFELKASIGFDDDLIFDQITYLPRKNIYVGSSHKWEIVILSSDFELINRKKVENGTFLPQFNKEESLMSILSYDQETYFDLYELKDNLECAFIHTFYEDVNNTSSGFCFNNNEFAVSFPNELAYFKWTNGQITQLWTLDISMFKSENNSSCLTFINADLIVLSKGKILFFIDIKTQKIIKQLDVILKSDIRDVFISDEKGCLIVSTDSELRIVSINEN